MSTIRTILKSSKDADGNYPVLLMLSDRGKRVYIATGFSAQREQFDDSKEGGRFLQGRGIRPFNVTRKEDNGSIGTYTNKEANDALANLELRASNILKSYQEKSVNWWKFRCKVTPCVPSQTDPLVRLKMTPWS